MNSKRIGIIVVSLAASALIVSAASAQQGQPQPPPQQDQQQQGQPPLRGNRPAQGLLGDLVQTIASDLNLQPRELLQQLRGSTLADVITANGGSVDAITAEIIASVTDRVNQAVTAGNLTQERADQILANLPDTVQQALNGQLRADRPLLPNLRPNPVRDDVRPLIGAATEATGLTAQEIGQEMRDGKTLSDVITEHGATPDAVIASAVATLKEHLDPAVTSGQLTQDQENRMLDGAQALFEAVMNGAFRQQPPAQVNT